MRNDDFEWDDAKAEANYARHSITFAMASDVFDDPFAILELDDSQHDEDRYSVIGMVENRLLFVAYALRGDRIRIISARLAEPYERRQYHEKNR
jgi:uncharacterized DUF497 family protein